MTRREFLLGLAAILFGLAVILRFLGIGGERALSLDSAAGCVFALAFLL